MDSRNSEVVFVRTNVKTDTLGQNLSGDYVASASQGIYSEFTFNYTDEFQFSNIKVYFLIDGKPYLSVPSQTEVVSGVDQNGLEHVVYFGSVNYLVDKTGAAVEKSKISKGTMRIELVINKDKSAIVSTSLDVLAK